MKPAGAESCPYILHICILIYSNTYLCAHIRHMTGVTLDREDMEPVGIYTYVNIYTYICFIHIFAFDRGEIRPGEIAASSGGVVYC